MSSVPDAVGCVLAYHERTKHHPQRYARALGYMDWETQPDPFRTYAGAPRIDLPLAADGVQTSYGELYTGDVEPRSLELASISAFFEPALGITAWKEYGNARLALRADPSSGNLHPTEGYAILPEVSGLPAGVHHYVSRDHCLERRCTLSQDAARKLEGSLRRSLPRRSLLDPLARVVEVRRASFPLLPARRRPRDRHGPYRGGRLGLARPGPRRARRRKRGGAPGARPGRGPHGVPVHRPSPLVQQLQVAF